MLLKYDHIEGPDTPHNFHSYLPSPAPYFTLGHTRLFPTASATHPPIKHNPPKGVTGPRTLNRCGSKTSRYILPLNMVIPAVNRPRARVFCGAIAEVNVKATECINCRWVSAQSVICFSLEILGISRQRQHQKE
jgi:hypothetical protein